jgi:hypothetical protein
MFLDFFLVAFASLSLCLDSWTFVYVSRYFWLLLHPCPYILTRGLLSMFLDFFLVAFASLSLCLDSWTFVYVSRYFRLLLHPGY